MIVIVNSRLKNKFRGLLFNITVVEFKDLFSENRCNT